MFSRFTFCHNFKNEIEKLRKHRKYMNTMKFENYFFIVLCIVAKIETTRNFKLVTFVLLTYRMFGYQQQQLK